MTRTMIATVLATVLGASLAAAQTTTPAKPTMPTTPAAPTVPAAPTAPTMPSTGAVATPATGTPTMPGMPGMPSTTSTTTPAITGGSNMFKTEADAKAACTGDTVVWANTSHSKVYHLSGDKYYGHTHHGAYMCMKAAVAAGYHAPGASTKAKTTSTHS